MTRGLLVVDGFVRKHMAWFLLAIFSIEGATGMVPAIYMDISTNGLTCNATQSLSMVRIDIGGYM